MNLEMNTVVRILSKVTSVSKKRANVSLFLSYLKPCWSSLNNFNLKFITGALANVQVA
jgi:hypothetical protein